MSDTPCYHCGDPIDRSSQIDFDDHSFCCSGCKNVYQILSESELDGFYNLSDKVGKVSSKDESQYLALDNEEIISELLDFESDTVAKITFSVPAIHCSSCIWLLEHLHRINPAVIKSSVNFTRKEATVTYHSNEITLRELAHLLNSIGYPPILDKKSKKKSDKDLVIRLAVAGFFFGNSMLISIPEYLDFNLEIDEEISRFFGYMNLVFSLPVFFYSATVYFKSAWKSLKHGFVNIDVPISIGILTLFFRSASDILFFSGLGYVDSLNGLVFFLLIGRWYQHKTYQALAFDRGLSSFFPMAVSKIVGEEEVPTKLEALEEGDVLLIRNQELIPADSELVDGMANIDYSFVTGESVPQRVEVGNRLFAGGRQIGAAIQVRLKKKVFNSNLTKLWNDQGNEEGTYKLSNLSDSISRYFTIIVVLLAIVGGVVWWQIDPSKMMDVFTSILIVACPCALALAVPFSYGHTMRVFGGMGFYVKNANVIESMSKVKEIVFDKTGTLSMPLPENVLFEGESLGEEDLYAIKAMTANSAHPLSQIISKSIELKSVINPDFFEEQSGKGILATIKDVKYKLGSASWTGAESVNDPGETRVYVSRDQSVLGYYVFRNSYRSGVFEFLEELRSGYKMTLLSGDNAHEKERLEPYFDYLRFEQSPEDKRSYVEERGNENHSVMMVGDGLNDAGALANSDVGVSISGDVYQFTPASDAILDAKRINLFDKFIQFSNVAVKTVWIAFGVSFAYNLVGLTFAFLGKLTPLVSSILMPVSSVTVVVLITLIINYQSKRLLKTKLLG